MEASHLSSEEKSEKEACNGAALTNIPFDDNRRKIWESVDSEIERREREDGISREDLSALHKLYLELFELEERRLFLIRTFVINSLNLSRRPTRLRFLVPTQF